VFGLRPVSRAEEGEIVKGWLDREERRGLAVGQLWYLISMDWWRNWNDYVSNSFKVRLCKKKKKCNVIILL
jgi:ubiquitin carboxyl-terminal hydrolase 6/32